MHQGAGSRVQPFAIPLDIGYHHQSEYYSIYTLYKPTILQDVIDSDTKEIVSEYVAYDGSERNSNPSRFRQKFQKIVQQERGENFISKLHRGKLDIIPWPVIESSRFYDLFGGLKNRFDRQPITHQHAGAFLTVLKMLMAKLKVGTRAISMLGVLTFDRQMIGGPLIVSKS
jgi:hypothetical protein